MTKQQLLDKVNEFQEHIESIETVARGLKELAKDMQATLDDLPADASEIEEDKPEE